MDGSIAIDGMQNLVRGLSIHAAFESALAAGTRERIASTAEQSSSYSTFMHGVDGWMACRPGL